MAAHPSVPGGHDIFKIGLSNDIDRRSDELDACLPAILGPRWRKQWSAALPSASDAHGIEQSLLGIAAERGWSGAGAFVIAPAGALEAMLVTTLRARQVD